MMPQPPVAIPQQQMIHISMVAPSTQRVVEPTPVVEVQPIPDTPPSPKGMKKVQPVAKPVAKKPKPVEEEKEIAEVAPASAKQTSGLQSAEATQQHAAVTEPVAADYLRNPPPIYPRAALRKRMQGTVLIEVRVSTNGLPLLVSLERSSGHYLLDEAALKAVKKWKFVPAHRGSEMVEASVVVPVEFKIN
jgi:protein TonB